MPNFIQKFFIYCYFLDFWRCGLYLLKCGKMAPSLKFGSCPVHWLYFFKLPKLVNQLNPDRLAEKRCDSSPDCYDKSDEAGCKKIGLHSSYQQVSLASLLPTSSLSPPFGLGGVLVSRDLFTWLILMVLFKMMPIKTLQYGIKRQVWLAHFTGWTEWGRKRSRKGVMEGVGWRDALAFKNSDTMHITSY